MRDLNWQFKTICSRNLDGSFGTKDRRSRELALIGRQLKTPLGYNTLKDPREIGERHIRRLIELWRNGGGEYGPVGPGTIKNRLAALRWMLEKIGRKSVMHPSNEFYDVARRSYIPEHSKAITLTDDQLSKIDDVRIVLALRMEAAFGLRMEEALKYRPSYSYSPGDAVIKLRAQSTKGGRPREIPVTTDDQRVLLAEVAAECPSVNESLIWPHLKYVQMVYRYKYFCRKAGIKNPHGLRHAFAQWSYEERAKLEAPINRDERQVLTPEEIERDDEARLHVSKILGHNRKVVTSTYIGAARGRRG